VSSQQLAAPEKFRAAFFVRSGSSKLSAFGLRLSAFGYRPEDMLEALDES